GRRRDRGRRARRAVDHGHLAEELTLAELDDAGLAGAVHFGDLDLAVEHDEQLAAGPSLLEDASSHIERVDALLERHGTTCHTPKRIRAAGTTHVSRGTMTGKQRLRLRGGPAE